MTATRRFLLVLASIAGFFVAGCATILFLLAFGQSLLGWHDNIGPEIRYGAIAGMFGATGVALYLQSRWSRPAKRSDDA